MFGIGLPEMILILALALIVVGPDKLPDLARSLAKGIMELKKTAEGLKESFSEEGNPLDEIRPDLEEAARSLKDNLLDPVHYDDENNDHFPGVNPPADEAAAAYKQLMKKTEQSHSAGNGNTNTEKTGDDEPVIDIEVAEEQDNPEQKDMNE
jgi:sec-independent protein translocase protein TatB